MIPRQCLTNVAPMPQGVPRLVRLSGHGKVQRRVLASQQASGLNKIAAREGLAACRDARTRLYDFSVEFTLI